MKQGVVAKGDVSAIDITACESMSIGSSPEPLCRKRGARFDSDELTCFRRMPYPSPLCGFKAEVYWNSTGTLRRTCSESGLHILPHGKGDFYNGIKESLSLPSLALAEPEKPSSRPDRLQFLPGEESTAMVLEQIFPRSPMGGEQRLGEDVSIERVVKHTGKRRSQVSSKCMPDVSKLAYPRRRQNAKAKFVALRQTLLDKFATVTKAFETFQADACGDGDMSRKDFGRFLTKHFGDLPREEHGRIFDFLDADKSGTISMAEFRSAVEAAAPVRTLEDLRKRFVALGWPSMREAFRHMAVNRDMSERLNLNDFGALLSQVGVHADHEHSNLFVAIADPNNTTATVSLNELASAMAAVSPSLLLEDVRQRLLKKYDSLSAAYQMIDIDMSGAVPRDEFIRFASLYWKMTHAEAEKAFRLMDTHQRNFLSRVAFESALNLSEPALHLEELRWKVRQRFRSICEMLKHAQDEDAMPPPDGSSGMKPAPNGQHGLKTPEVRSVAGGSVAGENSPEAVLNAFKGFAAQEAGQRSRMPAEWHSMLAQVQLSEFETGLLFSMVDINRDGHLTALEFVRGIGLFAPACSLEDLRHQCLKQHMREADAFATLSQEKRLQPLCPENLGKVLEQLDLLSGLDVKALVDIIEPSGHRRVAVGELIAALQSSSPGVQLRLPTPQRDAKVRQQVRWTMAPFHKSAAELRSDVRAGPPPPLPRQDAHGAARNTGLKGRVHSAGDKFPSRKQEAKPRQHQKQQQDSTPVLPPGMRESYSKISKFLCDSGAGESDGIMERIRGYYSSAGNLTATDRQLLAERHSRSQQFSESSWHYSVLEQPLV
mmetsp:Transcript_14142/g.27466  ORF Transcript_14142/g.27466 Transcript_14142/m.27466 type:complete len:827 (-) Transcript_14142:267-2747(-)